MENQSHPNENRLETLKGTLGIVVMPDEATVQKTREIARKYSGKISWEAPVPHISIYQANLQNVPVAEIRDLISVLNETATGSLELGPITVYGGKFLFWNVVNKDILKKLHEKALGLSRFLDRSSQSSAQKEGLALSSEEKENIEKYGYPTAGNLYQPHITIGYNPEGINLDDADEKTVQHTAIFSGVKLVELGKNGSITKFIE